jgi:hypothetical protein
VLIGVHLSQNPAELVFETAWPRSGWIGFNKWRAQHNQASSECNCLDCLFDRETANCPWTDTCTAATTSRN